MSPMFCIEPVAILVVTLPVVLMSTLGAVIVPVNVAPVRSALPVMSEAVR